MKKVFLVSILQTFFFIVINAQNPDKKINEIGIDLNGSVFGVRYNIGNKSTALRLSLLSVNGYATNYKSANSSGPKTNSQGVSFQIGFEKRKLISEGLFYYLGSDLMNSMSKYTYKDNNSTTTTFTFSPGLGLVMGLGYNISDKFKISAEVIPHISYSYQKDSQTYNGIKSSTTSTQLDYSFKSDGVFLTVQYRMGK